MSKSGLVGHFGNKEQLQLATLDTGLELFAGEVWRSVEHEPPGRPRLLALCDAWLSFFEREVLPDGCLKTTASVEFDARPGPVRDAVATAMRRWLDLLETQAAIARARGELPDDAQPADIAFQLKWRDGCVLVEGVAAHVGETPALGRGDGLKGGAGGCRDSHRRSLAGGTANARPTAAA